MIWKVPKMWKGQTVFIVGGGPSLNRLDLSLIHDKRCIGVNNAYMLGDWIDLCWFGDSRWLEWHSTYRKFVDGWREFAGIRASCVARVRDHKDIKYVELSHDKPMGIETNPSKVSWNKTSGSSAINIAYHLGAKRIVLLGFDMQIVDTKQNWHNDHVTQGDRVNPYPRFMKAWKPLTDDLKKLGVELINCCMDSAIPEEFVKRVEYLDVLKEEGDKDNVESTKEGYKNAEEESNEGAKEDRGSNEDVERSKQQIHEHAKAP